MLYCKDVKGMFADGLAVWDFEPTKNLGPTKNHEKQPLKLIQSNPKNPMPRRFNCKKLLQRNRFGFWRIQKNNGDKRLTKNDLNLFEHLLD